MERLLRDVRYSIRLLSKNPVFALVATSTIALGIAANATIFSFLDALLLRPIGGVADSGRVVAVYTSDFSSGPFGTTSYPDFLDVTKESQVFEGAAGYEFAIVHLTGGDSPERAVALKVSGDYFKVLGVGTVAGRPLEARDQARGGEPVVVVSHAFWHKRFGSDRSLIGQPLVIDGVTHRVVGVASPGFRGLRLGSTPEIYVPIVTPGNPLGSRGNRSLDVVARLRPGVSLAQAQSQITALAAHLAREHPDSNRGTLDSPDAPRPMAVRFESRLGAPDADTGVLISTLLTGVIGFILLIACANVANLLLSRASTRRREVAIRLALGATRIDLGRQLLIESMVIALAGGCAGFLIALWVGDLAGNALPISELEGLDLHVNHRVFIFTLTVSIASGVLFGLAPALQSTRPNVLPSLKDQSSPAFAGRRIGLRDALVVAQIAMSLVVLIGAGLFLRSLRNAATTDLGFSADNVVVATFELPPTRFTPARAAAFYAQLQDRIAQLPGVTGVGLASTVPLSGGGSRRGFQIEGHALKPNEDRELNTNVVSPGFFRTLGIPLLAGRDFSSRDLSDAPGVAIVNEALATRYFAGGTAIGRRLRTSRGKELEIVGVAATSKHRTLRDRSLPVVYIAAAQEPPARMTILLGAAAPPSILAPRIRGELAAIDRTVPLYDVRTLREHIGLSVSIDRTIAALLTVAGVLAMVLAAIGIYGVISYTVAQQTREIGIRIALGASPRRMLGLVLRQGLRRTIAGIALGIAGAAVLTRITTALLFEISATDPLTFTAISLLLFIVALAATAIPAHRAMRVDPLVALKAE